MPTDAQTNALTPVDLTAMHLAQPRLTKYTRLVQHRHSERNAGKSKGEIPRNIRAMISTGQLKEQLMSRLQKTPKGPIKVEALSDSEKPKYLSVKPEDKTVE